MSMELLAPVGGFEQLKAAINFGADAVYLAADRYGMRARASNFRMEEIPAAVDFAHENGVSVYVTCNVLIHENELHDLIEYFTAINASGADALIVSDLGAFSLARQYAPDCSLHVSTQASVANSSAANMWHGLGASRIVCAREMSMGSIKAMRENIPEDLELETFVHGAQCMAISGRCLISAYLCGRSANKGHCTQPCRWHYTAGTGADGISDPEEISLLLEEEKRPGTFFPIEEDGSGTYLFNSQDLCMLEHLGELEDAGVNSIKIEGRNKKAFYVATVVGAYRRVLDGANPADVMEELYAVSHRPYGTGFYFGEGKQENYYDGYEQDSLHVADVIACLPKEDGGPGLPYKLITRCRNRYAEGQTVEVLPPYEEPFEVTVKNLAWMDLPDEVRDKAQNLSIDTTLHEKERLLPLIRAGQETAVPVANRSCNYYAFETGRPVSAGSFLRIRQKRRSSRH
ncbi:MAG: U32 family peptidase [Eggerthellaceae bacterium]|nr:U32 family peptidase [Eggerthellaceae bacterium]